MSKKFVYVGDPNGPEEAFETKEAFGLVFEPGEAVEVTDSEVIRKLEGNNHFAEEGSVQPKRKAGRPRKAAADE